MYDWIHERIDQSRRINVKKNGDIVTNFTSQQISFFYFLHTRSSPSLA